MFYSHSLGQPVKGLTIPANGVICLSWNHFEVGYKHASDNLYLRIHEPANALMAEMENFRYDDSRRWKILARKVMPEMNEDNSRFFRPYGSPNIAEFWAVCLEIYFETPLDFHSRYPQLYAVNCVLPRQDYTARLSKFEREKFMVHV